MCIFLGFFSDFAQIFGVLQTSWTFGGVLEVIFWAIFRSFFFGCFMDDFLNNLFLQIFISCSNSVSFRIRIPSILFQYANRKFYKLYSHTISSNRRQEQKLGKVRLNATIQTHVAKKVCYFYCKYFTLLSKNYSHQLTLDLLAPNPFIIMPSKGVFL